MPWPWAIDVAGQGTFFPTKADAIAAVNALQVRGVHSIDVGCVQINLAQHPNAFHSLEDAFDPAVNTRYGAAFLMRLFALTRSWQKAAASLHHSATPTLGAAYERKVLAAFSGRYSTVMSARTMRPQSQSLRLLRHQLSLPQAAMFYERIASLEGRVRFDLLWAQSLRFRASLQRSGLTRRAFR